MALTQTERERICWFLPTLPVMRASIRNSQMMGEYPDKHTSRNPLLNFTFWFAITGVVLKSTLILAELVDPLLDKASVQYLGKSLFVGRARKRKALSPHFHMLLTYRTAVVAHQLKLWPDHDAVVKTLRQQYGNTHNLLLAVLDEVETLIPVLLTAGLNQGLPTYTSSEDRTEYTLAELAALINAVNGAA